MIFKKLHLCGLLFVFYLVGCQNNNTKPACHPGILVLFNWCEQSDCASNCKCTSNKVCKQICEQKQCGKLYCNSSSTCHQSVLTSRYVRTPKVAKMFSVSPITQQDCSEGYCDVLSALKYKEKSTKVFQSCSEGKCGILKSNAHQVKQFCDNCDQMICYGKTKGNCTQLCIIGKCKKVKCTSQNCKQLCSHGSHCNLQCSENVESCRQECIHGSTCNFDCRAKKCTLICDENSKCTYKNSTDIQTTITTISKYIYNKTKLTKHTLKSFTTKQTSIISTTRSTASTTRTTTLSNEVELPYDNHVKNIKDVVVIENNTILTSMNLRSSFSSSTSLRTNFILSSLFVICIFTVSMFS